MHHILICDDDRDIVSALDIYLRAEGYATHLAFCGREALDAVAQNDIHLALMDIMMPGLDGISATAQLRETSNIPVILLTAKSEDSDKVLGLSIGADDYVTKPFNPVEVLARVKSQLRRYTQLGGMQKREQQLIIGGIVLDDAEKTVTADGEIVPPYAHRIRHTQAADGAAGAGIFLRRNLRRRMEGQRGGHGEYRGRAYTAYPRKAGDQPGGTEISEGGLGARLQDGKGIVMSKLTHQFWAKAVAVFLFTIVTLSALFGFAAIMAGLSYTRGNLEYSEYWIRNAGYTASVMMGWVVAVSLVCAILSIALFVFPAVLCGEEQGQ